MAEKQLNKEQLEAIGHKSGPLLIIAGAGTGKTTVIIERIKWLIANGSCSPQEILALTFTDKAALEMQTRLDEVMPLGYTRMWIMTFHGFCENLLREYALDIGLDPQFKILTQIDTIALLKKHMFDFVLDYYRPLGNPHKFLSAMVTFFSRLRDEEVNPEKFSLWAKNQDDVNYLELSEIYAKFQSIKEELGVLDFGDLIYYANRLLTTRPKILEKIKVQFKHVLVDEFQDTNYAQISLIKLLVNVKQNLTVVADDDQAIYQWRGAATGNVISFRDYFATIKIITLTQNYRSTQNILDNAHKLIANNNPDRLEIAVGINKKLFSTRKKSGEKIAVLVSQSGDAEAQSIAEKIKQIKKHNKKMQWRDFAILVRANNHAELFTKGLDRAGIPMQFLGPGKLFLQAEVKDLLAVLKLLANPGDDISAYRLLKMNYWKIDGDAITKIVNRASFSHISILESIRLTKNKTQNKIVDLYDQAAKLVHTLTPGQVLYKFLQDSGILKAMFDYPEVQAKNISKFFNKIKQFEEANPETSLNQVLEWVDLSLELGESPAATVDTDWSVNDNVNILTYHSAKGLEFPVVFMVNLVAGRFPSLNRKDLIEVPEKLIKEVSPQGDSHLQEERRLFYVGMTRARDQLFFSYAMSYGEGARERKASPFITDALGKVEPQSSQTIISPLPKKSPPVTKTNHKITYITYSQIQTFLDCPLHYKAKYILRLSTPPSAASSFGNSIHATLNNFYKNPGKDILQVFEKNWVPSGFENKAHERLYFKKGQKYLQKFIALNPPPYPHTVKLEENFKFFINKLTVAGKIDRVDVLANDRIEIIDYKTSPKMLTPKEAASDLQLSIYALAANKLKEKPFNKKPEDIVLSLYYLDTQTKVSTTRTAEQLKQAEQEILKYVDQIQSSDFACSGSFICQKCDFKMLCDFGDR